jgi:hypothetical protein
MGMESGRGRLLYIEDILAATPDSAAIRQDVAEQTQRFHREIAVNQGLGNEGAYAFRREVGLFVLRKLQERGVDDAQELETRMTELDKHSPDPPCTTDLIDLAKYYDGQRIPDDNVSQQAIQKRLAATAWATAGVVNYETARRLRMDEAIPGFDRAVERIKEAWLDLPENTHDKLVGLLVELRHGLHD